MHKEKHANKNAGRVVQMHRHSHGFLLDF